MSDGDGDKDRLEVAIMGIRGAVLDMMAEMTARIMLDVEENLRKAAEGFSYGKMMAAVTDTVADAFDEGSKALRSGGQAWIKNFRDELRRN